MKPVTITQNLVWQRTDGAEWCDLRLGPDQLAATGIQIGTTPVPYRVDYRVETAPEFVTTVVRLRSVGAGWQRNLTLRRFPDGEWDAESSESGSGPGALAWDPDAVRGAFDVDLGLSPLTNTLPIRRLGLLAGPAGEPQTILTAWVSVPDLAVRVSAQDYMLLRPGLIRYASGTFTADIEIDAEGIVTNYPQLGTLIGASTALE